MNEEQVIQERDGYVVTLSERSFTFKVCGDGRYLRDFPSFKQADDWITAELRAAAKSDRRQIALDALSPTGERITIVGINVNTGNLKLKTDNNYAAETPVYPYSPQLEKLLTELAGLDIRVRKIRDALHACGITRYTMGRLESANYNHYVKALEEKYKKAAAAVAALPENL